MPTVDEESALTLSTLSMESLHDLDTAVGNPLASHPDQQVTTPTVSNSANSSTPGLTPAFHRMENGQNNNTKKKPPPKPRLLHPILHKVPLNFRFGLYGFLSNVSFMVAYNAAVVKYENMASSSTIYATVYLVFIPFSHAIISLLVFGWPERYVRSLVSNAPVGLTAIVLGAALTAYLDQIEFNVWVAEAVTEYRNILGYTIEEAEGKPKQIATTVEKEASRGGGEFYSSLFVLIVTGIWTYVLSVMVNAPAEPLAKKEL